MTSPVTPPNIEQSLINVLTGMGLNTVKDELVEIKTAIGHMETKHKEMETAIQHTQESQTKTDGQMVALRTENDLLKQRLELTENRLTEIEKKHGKLETRVIDTQFHTMKNNLVFYNIPESTSTHTRENAKLILTNFLKINMKIPNFCFQIPHNWDTSNEMDKIIIERCHRFGSATAQSPRPIVAVCTTGRNVIMKHAKNLAGTKFFVSQQMPPELSENKQQVSAVFRNARSNGRKPRYIGKGDMVLVDGQVHKALSVPLCATPTLDLVKQRPKINICGSNSVVEKGNKFVAHTASINNRCDIAPVVSIIKHSYHSLSRATHNTVCARIATTDGVLEYTDDDGEYSASRHMLQELRKYNITNQVVVVTRWASEQQLGKRRFTIIGHVTRNALEKSGRITLESMPQNTSYAGNNIRSPEGQNVTPQRNLSFDFRSPQAVAM